MSDTELSQARRAAHARMMHRRRVTFGVAVALVLLLLGGGIAWAVSASNRAPSESGANAAGDEPTSSPQSTAQAPQQSESTPGAGYDLDSPDSITVVVNKQRPFHPVDWAPSDLVSPNVTNNNGQPLREVAAVALEAMNEAATAEGLPLTFASAYRSYSEQGSLYSRYVASDGQAAADTYSARPGFSEHQTGLATDLTDGGDCTLEECFGETPTGQWLRENSWRYGFILRFDEGQEQVVGYTYEPWHFRYVGVDVATAMHEQGVANLEDFMGLPAAPTY